MSENGRLSARSRWDFLKFHLITRLIDVQPDQAIHRKKLTRGLVSTTIYAVAYGIYEYFVVYKGLMWVVFDETVNWAIMMAGLIIVVLASTRANIELCVVSLLYLFLVEDLAYWSCQWGETGVFPFPALDWFDGFFASFRVLGGIGKAIYFWPYVPLFYIPGFGAMIGYYFMSWKSATAGRIVAWIIGSFFIAIMAGALATEEVATLLLIFVPSAFASIVVIALAVRWHDARSLA